jgi:SAM-dependent MidA family methyltransferase
MISINRPLEEIIRSGIVNDGPISFRDFMDTCLYHPGLGYYTSGKERIGSAGDFYTSPSLTPVFGAMIACQIAEMIPYVDTKTFTTVEFGGGKGQLSRQIMQILGTFANFKCDVRYFIIEKNRPTQQHVNHSDPAVHFIEKISDLGHFSGVVISNELLDNFPVHRFVKGRELFEVFVEYKDGNFGDLLQPVSAELRNSINLSELDYPTGAQFEWNAEMKGWLNTIFSVMQQGFILNVDYGSLHHRLLNQYMNGGTISCYYNHQRNNNPYFNIGMQDITSDVNFSLLNLFARAAGFCYTGFTSQVKFLLSMGLCGYIDNICTGREAFDTGALIKSFVLEMGTRFNVMIHHKGISKPVLKGLQFAEG